MSLRTVTLFAATALALACSCATAGADVFEGLTLSSESSLQQAEYAHDAVISANGGYVVFDGSYGGVTGVWRRDLGSDAIVPVAVGTAKTPAGSAELPSVSSDGRYVSFTTTAALVPGDSNASPDVYVRDMSVPEGSPCQVGGTPVHCAFELASAVSNSAGEPEVGLAYVNPGEGLYGSLAAGRTALSADGRRVAFVTTAISNLAGEGTPALQVAVRDLDTHQTTLVSAAYDPSSGTMLPGQPVSGVEGSNKFGAVYSPAGVPPAFRQVSAYAGPPGVGASISADGSTVAWMGQDIPQQAPMLSGEEVSVSPSYAEPLWRRVADGPLAPTRRVTGGSEPTNPACIAEGEASLPPEPSLKDPCQGPFITGPERGAGIWLGGAGDVIPRLSANGDAVAFLANAPLVSLGRLFGGAARSDLYVADMTDPSATRRSVLRALTELASGASGDLATTAPVIDVAVSPDGSEVAFTTLRTQFHLGTPSYVTPPAAEPGLVELFDVDFSNDTLTRVTQGLLGAPPEHPLFGKERHPGEDPYEGIEGQDGALSPSFSADGNSLAFTSTASNLTWGDGNTPARLDNFDDGADAFVIHRRPFVVTPTESYVSPPPAGPAIVPAWRLNAVARSRADGSVVLEVGVPGAGALSARASAQVPVTARSARSSGHGRRGRHTPGLVTRTVTSVHASAVGPGKARLTLKLTRRYRPLASRAGGVFAEVVVSFAAAGHAPLRETIEVDFRRAGHAARRAHAKGTR
jgi:hypothetical protein